MSELDRTPDRIPPRVFEPVARADTDSWINVVADVIRFADIVNGTEFVPKGIRGSAPATAAAILYGREVGLPPMTSLSSTHVVDGRPAINAEAMRALVFAAGHEISVDTSNGSECTMRGRRRGSDQWTSVTWSLAMARAANLVGRDNWKKYPRAMLAARATAELCRLIFPDVIHGFAAVEEIDDLPGGGSGGPLTAPTSPGGGTPAPKPVRRRSSRTGPQTAAAPQLATVNEIRAAESDDARRAGGENDTPGPGNGTTEGFATRSSVPRPHAPRPVDPGDVEIPLPGEPGYDDGDSGGDSGPSAPDSGGGSGDDDVAGEAGDPAPPDGEPASPVADVPIAPRMVSRAQVKMLHALCGDLDLTDRDQRLQACATIVGRGIKSTNDLSADEATGLIDTLSRLRTSTDLASLLDHIRAADQTKLPL